MTTHDCESCGEAISGGHAVRGGEHYCRDCADPLVRDEWYEPGQIEHETAEEYNERRSQMLYIDSEDWR